MHFVNKEFSGPTPSDPQIGKGCMCLIAWEEKCKTPSNRNCFEGFDGGGKVPNKLISATETLGLATPPFVSKSLHINSETMISCNCNCAASPQTS